MNRLLAAFCLALLPLLPGAGRGEQAVGAAPGADVGDSGDWLEFYYLDPKPGEFIEQMKKWAADGTLKNFDSQPVLIGFISQLMRQNRDKIQSWWLELKPFSKEDRIVFGVALLFARVSEADAIIADAMGEKYSQYEDPGKILEIPLDKPATLPMLWGYYFATGSKSAIRRMVLAFRYELMPEKPEGVKIPEGYVPFYTELPRMVYVSMISHLQRHPRLVEICEEMLRTDQTLHAIEKENLYDLLSEVKPAQYPPRPMPPKAASPAQGKQ